MKFEVLKSPLDVAAFAALVIERVVSEVPGCAVALPTGKTPLLLYRQLAERCREVPDLFRGVHWFALDDFWCPGIPAESRFSNFLLKRFIEPAGLRVENFHFLDSDAVSAEAEGERYEELIRSCGGLELAVLGLGLNGHIAFNEPGTPVDSRTGRRDLTDRSRQANAYLFGDSFDATPCHGITLGLGTLLEARRIMVIATGSSKADPVLSLRLADEFKSSFPASALTLHSNVTLVTDIEAGNPRV